MRVAGLSLAGTVLAGLVLNQAGGLTPLSWEIALAVAVTACAGVVLAVRKRGARPEQAKPVRNNGFHLSPLAGAFLLIAVALAGGAVWLANASANWQRSPGFAQLWLVPGKRATATLAVRDGYPGRLVFRLALRGVSETAITWDLKLADGETWQQTVTVPPGGKLAATLTTPDRVLPHWVLTVAT
jgi:hypothetical protein